MRNTVLATAVVATLLLAAGEASAQTKGAATKAEVQSIQAQMQVLADRLNKLEAANATLQSENAELEGDRGKPRCRNRIPEVPDQGLARGIGGGRRMKFRRSRAPTGRRRSSCAATYATVPRTSGTERDVGGSAEDAARPLSPTDPCTTRLRCDRHGQPEGDLALRDGWRRSAFLEPDPGIQRHAQADRPLTWPTPTGSSCKAATSCSASSHKPCGVQARVSSSTATTTRKAVP